MMLELVVLFVEDEDMVEVYFVVYWVYLVDCV